MVCEGEMSLREIADSIPCLGKGGKTISSELIKYASEVPEGSCIIEVGPFLGSGTSYLAIGHRKSIHRPIIYAIDPWIAAEHYVKAAKKHLGLSFKPNEDLMPHFVRNLLPFHARIKKIRADFLSLPYWTKEPIGLIVMDAGSTYRQMEVFHKNFAPRFIPGTTRVILLDYYFYETHPEPEYLAEKDYCEKYRANYKSLKRKGTAEILLYLGGLEGPNVWASDKRTICEVLREIGDLHQDEGTKKLLSEATVMAKKMARKLLEYNKEAFKDFWDKNPDYEADLKRRIDNADK